MALLEVNIFSKEMMRPMPITVILPVDKLDNNHEMKSEEKPFKTLYLLHGAWGNCMDWLVGTRIYRWAEERNLAVVMPSGDNSFYIDHMGANNNYGRYIGKELVEMTRRMFPLSEKREDTFIAGLSMGGYGAVYHGLKYHDTFSCIAGLSSAFDKEELLDFTYDAAAFGKYRKDAACCCYGNMQELILSDVNPEVMVDQFCAKLHNNQAEKSPKIYLGCGTEDEALNCNRSFRDYLVKRGFEVTYEESPGNHEWDYWDGNIKKILDWLPLS
jgi:Predicted esterase